jgi:hypothetical protein
MPSTNKLSPAPSVLDGRPIVMVVRDPDSSNEYTAWPGVGVPHCVDVDLGNVWPEEEVTLTGAWGEELERLHGHPAHDELVNVAANHWPDDRETVKARAATLAYARTLDEGVELDEDGDSLYVLPEHAAAVAAHYPGGEALGDERSRDGREIVALPAIEADPA